MFPVYSLIRKAHQEKVTNMQSINQAQKPCHYGNFCRNKALCKFLHPEASHEARPLIPKPCHYGNLCRNKALCKFRHPEPSREMVPPKPCHHGNLCRNKATCKFSHETNKGICLDIHCSVSNCPYEHGQFQGPVEKEKMDGMTHEEFSTLFPEDVEDEEDEDDEDEEDEDDRNLAEIMDCIEKIQEVMDERADGAD